VNGFLRAALVVALSPLFFVLLGATLGFFHLVDPAIGREAVGRGLAAHAALAGVITGIVALGVAGYGGFRRLWPRAVLPLALSVASYLAAIYIL
jgi:hypothetical protein